MSVHEVGDGEDNKLLLQQGKYRRQQKNKTPTVVTLVYIRGMTEISEKISNQYTGHTIQRNI